MNKTLDTDGISFIWLEITCDKWQLLAGSSAQREILTQTKNYNSLKIANIEQ